MTLKYTWYGTSLAKRNFPSKQVLYPVNFPKSSMTYQHDATIHRVYVCVCKHTEYSTSLAGLLLNMIYYAYG